MCPKDSEKAEAVELEAGAEALRAYSQRFAVSYDEDYAQCNKTAVSGDNFMSKQGQMPGYSAVPKDIYPFLGLSADNGDDHRKDAPAQHRTHVSNLELTFGYAGSLDKNAPFALFDVRDEVCLQVGGFKHGQVLRDNCGGEVTVIGVKTLSGEPRLWFQPKGLNRAGAGYFPSASPEALRARFSLVSGAGARQLRRMTAANFDAAEDSDGEAMVVCSRCGLPLGNTASTGKAKEGRCMHGECLAQVMLQDMQEEAEGRQQEEAALKMKRRAQYEIGWKAEHIPENLSLVQALGWELTQHTMCCLALDDGSRTVRIAPTIEPAAAVNLQYLAVALQVRLSEGREPFFSLDPVDPKSRNSMQEKRFEPAWLAGTAVGEVLFQADYHLKELSMGEAVQPVVGMKSCLDFSEEEGQFSDWNAREWFVVKKAEVLVSEDSVLIPSLKMGVEAREQFVGPNGMEDVRMTRPDHPLVKYAQAFTDKFDLIAERRSVIHHLRELARASVLAKFLLESNVQLEDAWFGRASSADAACCLEVPQLWNERYRSQILVQDGKVVDSGKASCKSVNGVYGGVEFGIDKFDLAEPRTWRLRTAIAPAAPVVGARLPAPRGVAAPMVSTTLARAVRAVPTAPGVPGVALAVPRFSRRVKGVGAARGVDLNLDQFDLSSAEQVAGQACQSSDAVGAIGSAFWSHIDGSSSVFKDEDAALLRHIFNPHLSDRRDEGHRFVPPDTNLEYVHELRSLVDTEAKVKQARRDCFLSDKFAVGEASPLFPASWRSSFGITRAGPQPQARELVERPDYKAAARVFEQAMRAAAPDLDRSTEDGTRFRIYRFGSVEVRTTQEQNEKEVIGAIFSLRSAKEARARGAVQKCERFVKATEYVEAASQDAKPSGEPARHRSYVVFETEAGNMVLTEKLEDGTVAWSENPADLEDRNSFARVVRSADCGSAGIAVCDAESCCASEQSPLAASASQCKRFAQAAFSLASGARHADSGFRQREVQRELATEGEGGWHGARAQRYSRQGQSMRVRVSR